MKKIWNNYKGVLIVVFLFVLFVLLYVLIEAVNKQPSKKSIDLDFNENDIVNIEKTEEDITNNLNHNIKNDIVSPISVIDPCPIEYKEINNGTYCQYSNQVDPEITYSCPDNYNLNNKTCYNDTISYADVIYTCTSGGVLRENICYQEYNTYYALPSCPSGYTLGFSWTPYCFMTGSSIPAKKNYSCPDGYWILENLEKCSYLKNLERTYSYVCPSGYKLSGNNCIK